MHLGGNETAIALAGKLRNAVDHFFEDVLDAGVVDRSTAGHEHIKVLSEDVLQIPGLHLLDEIIILLAGIRVQAANLQSAVMRILNAEKMEGNVRLQAQEDLDAGLLVPGAVRQLPATWRSRRGGGL